MFDAQHRLSSTLAYVTTLLPSSSTSNTTAPLCDSSRHAPESQSSQRPPNASSPVILDPDDDEDMVMCYSDQNDQQDCQRHPASSFPVEPDASARSCAPPPPPPQPAFAVTSAPVGLQNNAKGLLFPSHPSPFPFPVASEPAFHSESSVPEPPSSPSAMSISQEQLLPPKVSFRDFALCYRQNQHKQAQRKRLERRLRATKVSIAVSARLARVGTAVQRGLVEGLKQDDKINFVNLYHTLHDLQSTCESTTSRHALHRRQDPLLEDGMSDLDPVPDHSTDFFLQLSPQSRSDLLDILYSVRTDPQFLFDRLCSLTSAQLAALISSSTDVNDSAHSSSSPSSPSSSSRSRAYPLGSSASSAYSSSSSFSKRVPSGPTSQDHVLAFERTNPLAVLLFNSYAAPLDTDTPEARLRVDVWSTVCAKLITHGGNRYYPLIGHILSAWALRSDWKAKPQFELYLMDILQTGAFLLEHIDPPPGLDFSAEPIDPLKTDVAEEFFASAVDSLFKLLDDPDAGLPRAVMEFASAVLRKLDHTDTRNRFLEYLFVHWFFSKFLYGALTYPEAQGLLLDFHIRNDAREKLLGQVGLQAYSQVFAVLRSMRHFSMPRPTVRQNVANMLYRLNSVASSVKLPSKESSRTPYHSSSVSLMLSATDILSLLDGLFPKATSPPMYQSSIQNSAAGSSLSSSSAHTGRPGLGAQPGFYRSKADHNAVTNIQNTKQLFPTDMDFLSFPDNSLHQNADRIRFELSQLVEPDEHRNLEHPSNEDWAIFTLSADGKRLTSGLFSDSLSDRIPNSSSDDDIQSTAWGIEGNYEALQTAVVKLIEENPTGDDMDDDYQSLISSVNDLQIGSQSLKQRFDRAMNHCHYESDFIGAHYWWNAGQQLMRTVASSSPPFEDDSWILGPMHASCVRSLDKAKTVAERCESDFVALERNMQRLQKTVKDTMATVTKIRNKMWYMTDVKNSMRYEDAKHLALALKTMVYSARLFKRAPADSRSRGGARGFGGSLLQKPELQVMDVIKAASSQGGPNKLSDEQVELTRKWLSHGNIDNFCRGEERIHRFCYEVKTSINRLVGDTMAETPALWASELFQKERAKFEGSSPRNFVGMSHPNKRPFSLASEDSGYNTAPSYAGSNSRTAPSVSKFSSDLPALQSLFSDKRRVSRDSSSVTDTSSVMGGSPSTTTGDSCSTFWSSPRPPTHYAASASSLYSRPPSMISETMTQPSRQRERTKTHEKSAFLDELRQTLASLLLTDLGSPVWSCGSETDAWFGNALDQKRIQTQMEKRARIQRFYDEHDERTSRFALRRMPTNRRSRSLDPSELSNRELPGSPIAMEEDEKKPVYSGPQPPFSYKVVFRRLVEVFSRHGNPFVKLKTLRELRELVIASLSTPHGDKYPAKSHNKSTTAQRKRAASYSNSRPRSGSGRTEEDELQTPTSPAAESVVFGSRPSDYAATPTANEIVETMRGLILEVKPKTVFRDLQFISAFVPSEILNKTDSGTAFVQFGLAALSLKDEVCNSMVEIADQIVSYELTRRHLPQGTEFQRHSHSHSRPGHAIEDAAGMWIITAKEGNPVAQRELAILYLTHPELLPRVTLPLTLPRDTFKAEMMYRRDEDSKSDPQSMCLALHWMQLSANGGDELARNRLRERKEFESIA